MACTRSYRQCASLAEAEFLQQDCADLRKFSRQVKRIGSLAKFLESPHLRNYDGSDRVKT